MKLSRQSRIVTALIVLIGVLFTQLAVAAYACPKMQIAHAIEALAASATASAHATMPGCEEQAAKQLPQCRTPADTLSLDKPELPQISSFVALGLQAEIIDDLARLSSLTASASPHDLTRTTSPPLSIRHCCFRI